MMGKRPADNQDDPSGSKDRKNKRIHIEPVSLGTISTTDEMDVKVLKFQNKKLAERLERRTEIENELRNQIERLYQRQATDELVLALMNKYWTQLEEDVKILFMRFDTPKVKGLNLKKELFESSDTQNQRYNSSEDQIREIDMDIDEDGVKSEDDGSMPREDGQGDASVKVEVDVKEEDKDPEASQDELIKKEPDSECLQSFLTKLSSCDQDEIELKLQERCSLSKDAVVKLTNVFRRLQEEQRVMHNELINKAPDEVLASLNKGLVDETKRLNDLVGTLQTQHQDITLQVTAQSDRLGVAETKLAEALTTIDNLQYDFSQAKQRAGKLEVLLEESYTKLKNATFECEGGDGSSGLSSKQLQSIKNDFEEQKSLAESRLLELDKLIEKHQESVKELEQTKMDLRRLPEPVIVESACYKCLQSQFSVLFKEATEMKLQLEEARNFLQQAKKTHLRQIEQMESDELACQKKLRTEMMQLEDNLAQVQKEYEMLRIEFEQNLAANEQAAPINRELRHLLSSYQTHNAQLKGDIQRYRRKFKEAQSEIAKLRNEASSHVCAPSSSAISPTQAAPSTTSSSSSSAGATGPSKDSAFDHKESLQETQHPTRREDQFHPPHSDKFRDERKDSRPESEIVRELKANLKKSQENQKEMKLLLDMYKGVAKEQRDKAQLMASERRVRAELEEAQQRLRYLEDKERKENRRLNDDDAMRKIRALEEAVHQLQKKLAEKKQEEEALLAEMDVTGQAFEDMQEQNTRLLQQLREKDEANFKLMAERIKSNQIHKLLQEEKNVLVDQVSTLQTQVDAQNQVVRKLEEKERILQTNLASVEKDLELRQQAVDSHKRKAVESTQEAAEIKIKLDRIDGKIEELQRLVKEKSSAVEQENHKFRRIQEECQSLRRKVERYKRMELASSADEVLMEEIRTYKEQLTCPCCKKGRKDVVLTKCFHVFCSECIKTRYETRQRKCPKCNAGFGANDYHRIWLD